MSTVQENPNVVKLNKHYEAYDENLNLIVKDVEIVFTEVSTVEEAAQKLNELNDYVSAANYLIRKNALSEAKKSAGLSGGINREVLMEFIKPYRESPQFAAMITATDKRKATSEEWNKQTQAILDQIKNVDFIMKSIRERSAATQED